MDDNETLLRRARLRELIDKCFDGVDKNLLDFIERKTGKRPNQGEFSSLKKDGGKSFGDKKARTITEQVGLHRQWFSMPLGSCVEKQHWLSPSPDTQAPFKPAESNAEAGPKIGRLLRIPVVGMAQLGDNGFWAELETPVGFGDGYIPFPAKSRDAYALRCRGDSMKPRIKNGEFVIVDPSLSPAPGDEVLVKAKDGRVMVKELLYVRDNIVHLLSVNEAHGKLALPIAEIEFIHGVAGIMPAHTWTND